METKKPKMTKDTVPEGFTLALAAVDALPVVFFSLAALAFGVYLASPVFLIGAALATFAGAAKVAWKFIVVLRRKNVWWMFRQMRILMPAAMLLMVLAVVCGWGDFHAGLVWQAMRTPPAAWGFLAWALGMALMIALACALDSADPKSNKIEQGVNAAAQLCLLLGVLAMLVASNVVQ
ncbi:MAG: hypothetical protein Q4C53_05790 [Clostridia bacterium]|nr:hypothetical protein [Clostridia bacterium]